MPSDDVAELIVRMQDAATDCDAEDRLDLTPIALFLREAIAKLMQLEDELDCAANEPR